MSDLFGVLRREHRDRCPLSPARRSARRVWLPRSTPSAAIALAVGMVVVGCSSEPDPALQAQPTVKSSARPTTPVATPALDECSLLEPSEVAPKHPNGTDETYAVASRSASPDPSGDGWRVICGYGESDAPNGHFVASVETTTGVSTKTFSEQVRPDDATTPPPDEPDLSTPTPSASPDDPTVPRRVAGLGDKAWVVADTGEDDGSEDQSTGAEDEVGRQDGDPPSTQIHILRDTTAVAITVRTPEGAEPDLKQVTRLGRTALSRLPETFTVPPVRLDGACAKINRALAVKAAGFELPGARSVTTETRSVCELSGTSGLMTITADSTPRARRTFAQYSDSPSARPVSDVGDAAYAATHDPLDDLWIRSGSQVLRVQSYDGAVSDPSASPEPGVRGDRLAFLQQVVSAFGS